MTNPSPREILQIRIAPEQPADYDDDLNRVTTGSYAGISPELAWERARGVWRLRKKRALAVHEVEIIDRTGTVLAVATVDDVEEFHGKYALVGTVIAAHPRVGRPSTYPHPFRNAIGYHPA